MKYQFELFLMLLVIAAFWIYFNLFQLWSNPIYYVNGGYAKSCEYWEEWRCY